MHCRSARAVTQDWLDDARGRPMPEPLREHVRDCEPCRAFISQWGRIELGLQSLRDAAPMPSLDMVASVRARSAECSAEALGRRRAYGRLALVGACVIALLLLVRILTPTHAPAPPSVSALAASTPGAGQSRQPGGPAPLPLATAP